jgi:hypothetical protein
MSVLGRRTVSVAAAIVVLSVALGGALSPQNASPVSAADPVVGIDPASAEVALDGTVDVDIVITDVSNPPGLYAATVHLTFDPAVLEVVDADPTRPGVQIFTGTFPCPSEGPCVVQTNAANNTAGTIDYDVTLGNPALPVSGNGTLATIRFSAKATGTSPVALESAALWDSLNEGIVTTPESGEVQVAEEAADTPQPTPTAASTATRTPTGTPRETNTPAPTKTPKPTKTPRPTATPKDTATPKPPMEKPESTKAAVAAAGAQPTPSGGALPSAGTGEMPEQMWRWFFLSGAVVMGLATWAFTFRFYARQKENERFWHR